MLDDPIKYGLLAMLAIALLVAAFTDLKSRRIANWLNGAVALGAPLFWWATGMALWPDMALQVGLAVATFFGVIHSALPEGSVYLPWNLATPLLRSIPYQFAAGYVVLAAIILLLSIRPARTAEIQRPAP